MAALALNAISCPSIVIFFLIVALLKQANTDSSKMAEVIGVSEAQLRFVTNTASGMGLIKCGSVVIPFDNQISKDTDLYKLYNTNIHEIIEQKKRVNEKC